MPAKKKKTPSPAKTAEQPSTARPGKMDQSLMMGIVFVLVIVGLGGGYYTYRLITYSSNELEIKNTLVQTVNSEASNVSELTNEENLVNSATNQNTNSAASTTSKPNGGLTVKWTTAKKVNGLSLLGNNLTDGNAISTYTAPVYYNLGSFTSGKYTGQQLIRVHFFYEGPQQYPTVEYYAVDGQSGTLLFKPSNPNVPSQYSTVDQVMSGYTARGLTVDTTTTIEGLFAPDTIIGPKSHQVLVRDPYPIGEFDATGMKVAFTDPVYGDVYLNPTPATPGTTQEMMSQVTINQRYGFYLKLADGMTAVYQLKFDFIKYDDAVGHGPYGGGVLLATWTNGLSNTQAYDTTLRTGCGSINYTDVVQPSEVSLANDLTAAGETLTGETVYQYSNSNAVALKQWYDNSYQVYDGTVKKSYDDFVADHPIVFVVDSFNRLARLTNATYQIMAECGKPVIYLYPKATTNVDVQLYPQGGFTKSEPAYNTGWHVTAQPNGQLTERATGITYPYLFWEGRGGIYTPPSKGFVVAQANVHAFLLAKLSQTGLNTKESADFIEFWEPRMQGSPYYFVSFAGNRVMDEIAPLQVTPKPDTVIRILMDFHPLQQPIVVQPQTLHPPTRTGFTVVEWGGVLR